MTSDDRPMDVYPTLTYRDVVCALSWIENAFGLEPMIFAAGVTVQIDHAALIHGDGVVLVESERPDELHGSHTGLGWVYVTVDDIDAGHERAKLAGAQILNEPHDAADGAQRGFSARPRRQPLDVRNGKTAWIWRMSLVADLPAWSRFHSTEAHIHRRGLQRLARLRNLRDLHIEKEGLPPSAFRFAPSMPALASLTAPDEIPGSPMTLLSPITGDDGC